MNRLDFIKKSFLAVSALALNPAQILKAEPGRMILYGDGIHDDSMALRDWWMEKPVYWPTGEMVGDVLNHCYFFVKDTRYFWCADYPVKRYRFILCNISISDQPKN